MTDYKMMLAEAISGMTDISNEQVYELVEIPPKSSMGEYAFPCFTLAKTMKKSPQSIAIDLSESLIGKLDFIERTEVVGPYLNIFINRSIFCNDVTDHIVRMKDKIGSSDEGKGKTVLVEYSSPNIAKPFHIGHAFTTILGQAIYNLYKHLGYDVYRLNHLGDYGTQFGKLISAYKRWGNDEALAEQPIKELLRIYVKFHDEAKMDPSLDEEARFYFRNLEKGNEEEFGLWKLFRDLSIKEFDAIYRRLGITFDDMNGESFYSDKIPEIVSMLNDRDLLVESDGARVVMLEEFGLPPCIILKSDGTTIYASRDIAAILYRKRKYDFYKNIYVVGNPQALHFKQVFAVADKLGLDASGSCVHVGFGLVKFADMKFSTRDGNIILQEELLNECVGKTSEIIRKNREERQTDMSDAELSQIAEKIGIGAVIYTFCRNSRDRDIVFSWDEMLDFDGDSAPYLMYTYARCRSVLRKAKASDYDPADAVDGFNTKVTDEEFELIKYLHGFGDSIRKAAQAYEPYILVRQLNFIARAFNKFYNNRPILNCEDSELLASGLRICEASSVVLEQGMRLLGISPVERM